MFKFFKQAFIALLSFIGSLALVANVSDHTKCVSLKNEPCIARATLIDLNLEELHRYPFMVSLDRCDKSRNNPDDL